VRDEEFIPRNSLILEDEENKVPLLADYTELSDLPNKKPTMK